MRIDHLPPNPNKKQVRRFFYHQLRSDGLSRWAAKRGARGCAREYFIVLESQRSIAGGFIGFGSLPPPGIIDLTVYKREIRLGGDLGST